MNQKNVGEKIPEWRERWRRKSTQHMRIYRHLDYFIKQALENDDSFFTIEQIREKLFDETGFHFHTGTLRKYLKKCQNKFGEAPLEEWDFFGINPEYYKNIKVKPPRNYKPKED